MQSLTKRHTCDVIFLGNSLIQVEKRIGPSTMGDP